MPFLTIAGIEVLVTDLAEQDPTLIGDTGRSFSGAWRGDTSGEIRTWRGTGLEVAASKYHELRSAVRRGTVEVQGGAIYGGWSRRMRVTMSGEYVPSGTAYYIVPGFTMEDAAVLDLAYLLAPDRTSGWTFSRASAATQVRETGLIETVAAGILRDQHYVGGERSVLLELARTNLLLWSEALDNAAWAKSAGATVTADAGTAPDGATTADRLVTTGGDTVSQSVSLTAGTVYTISGYVKSNTGAAQLFRLFGDSSLASSDLTATTAWQRFSYTFTGTTTGSRSNGITRPTSGATMDLLVWGFQLEAGAFHTSYIATTTATVTRAVDILSRSLPTGASLPTDAWARYTRLVAGMDGNGGLSQPRVWQIGTGTAFSILVLYWASSTTLRLYHANASSTKTADLALTVNRGDDLETLVTKGSDGSGVLAASVNGGTIVSADLPALAPASAWNGGANTHLNSRDSGSNAGAMALLRDAIKIGVPTGGTVEEYLRYMRGEAT